MGIFGKLTSPGKSGMSLLDRAAIFATAAEGDTEGALNYRNSLSDRMKLQRQQEFMAQLAGRLQGTAPTGPTYAPTNNEINVGMGGEGNAQSWSPEASMNPMRTSDGTPGTPGLNINSPDLAMISLMAKLNGFDMSGITDVLKAQAPEIDYNPSGEAYNRRTGALTGSVAPKVGEGMMVQRGPGGALSGIANAPGYVNAASEAAGSIEGAKEGAKAAWRTGPVRVGNTTVELPDSLRVGLLGQAFMRDNPGLSQGQIPQGFGVTPSEATLAGETAYAQDAAKAQVERDFTRPKAEAALSAMGAKAKVVDDAIARAMGLVGAWTAGPGGVLAALPGTPARDLQATLETIKANLGFDELQTMRDNSPTGGALGQVAVQELEALRATLSSLDQAQSPEALRQSLERIRDIRANAQSQRQRAFDATYGGAAGAPRRPSAPATQGRGYRILSVE